MIKTILLGFHATMLLREKYGVVVRNAAAATAAWGMRCCS
jgi:hypothetical protein